MPVPTTLTLSVADTNDGSATCTVSGGTAARTCQLLYAPRAAQVGPRAWAAGGTAVFDGSGNATVAPAPGFGYWNFMAAELAVGGLAAANLSPAYFRPLVDPDAQSVWDRCVGSVADVVTGLNLSGIASGSVVSRWVPSVKRGIAPAPPCVVVAPWGAEPYQDTGVTEDDDVGYPVYVGCFDVLDGESRANFTRDLLWREKISRAIRFQRLAAVPEVYISRITPDPVVNPEWAANNLLCSAVVFTFVSREPRGV